MKEKKNILIWVFPLLGIVFLAVVMLKRAPETFKDDNIYLSDIELIDSTMLKYKEVDGIGIELDQLSAMTIDKNDKIYISGDNKLLILNPDGSQANEITMNNPANCLTVDGNGNIFAGFGNYVGVYDDHGKQITEWARIDHKSVITSMTINENSIFIADAGTRIVWKFDLHGKLLGKIAVENKNEGIPKLIIPSPFFDVVTAKDSSIWVVNPGLHKLENFTVDGKLKSVWGKSSPEIEGFCGCCNPTHIAILKDGSIVTAEKGYPRVKVYDSKGTFSGVVAGGNQFKEGTRIQDLAVDSKNRILVLDPKMKKIRIFIKK